MTSPKLPIRAHKQQFVALELLFQGVSYPAFAFVEMPLVFAHVRAAVSPVPHIPYLMSILRHLPFLLRAATPTKIVANQPLVRESCGKYPLSTTMCAAVINRESLAVLKIEFAVIRVAQPSLFPCGTDGRDAKRC
jgi:hypothetical protein